MKRGRLLVLAGLAALAALEISLVWRIGLGDDAFIFFRYAQNLLDGQGLVFNPGERVEGFTSPLWLMILAGVGSLGIPLEVAAGLLGLVLFAVLVLLSRDEERSLHAPLFLLTCAPLVLAAGNGLETGLLMTALLFAVREQLQERDTRAALAYALVPLIRPDGVLFAAVALAGMALRRRKIPWKNALIVAAPACLYQVFRLQYYGEWLPTTFYIKVQTPELVLQSLPLLARNLGAYLPGVLLLVVFAACVSAKESRGRFVAVAALVQLLYVLRVGEDPLVFRYLVPIVPSLAYAFLPRLKTSLVAVLVAVNLLAGGVYLHENLGMFLDANRRFVETAKWLSPRAQRGQSLAVLHIGAVAHYNPEARVDDLLGLADLHIAKLPPEKDILYRGHQKCDLAYSVSKGSDWFFFLADAEMGAEGELQFRFISPQGYRFLNDPGFRDRYVLADFYKENGAIKGVLFKKRADG